MKTKRAGFLSLLLGLLLLCGCAAGPSEEDGDAGEWVLSAEPEYVAQWPENEFTACVPEPEAGTVDYVRDYSDSGRYEIVMKDLSQSESADYVEELIRQGYTELAGESNEVSAGVILQRDAVTVSVAYSGAVLNLLITMQ